VIALKEPKIAVATGEGTVGTPSQPAASDFHAPSGWAVGASFRRRSWWLPPEDATQHLLQIVDEGIAAERVLCAPVDEHLRSSEIT